MSDRAGKIGMLFLEVRPLDAVGIGLVAQTIDDVADETNHFARPFILCPFGVLLGVPAGIRRSL